MSSLTAYRNMRGVLKTGDLVLFSGNGAFSKAIKLFSLSKWSHVGIVVKIDDYDMLLLWESTSLGGVLDKIDNIPKKGVRTVALSERIASYDGHVAFRKLSKPISHEMRKALIRFRHSVKDCHYEKNKWELAKSLLDSGLFSENKEDLSSIFCSELVAEALQKMGILSENVPSNEFTPKDFGEGQMFERHLRNHTYGPEVEIK